MPLKLEDTQDMEEGEGRDEKGSAERTEADTESAAFRLGNPAGHVVAAVHKSRAVAAMMPGTSREAEGRRRIRCGVHATRQNDETRRDEIGKSICWASK